MLFIAFQLSITVFPHAHVVDGAKLVHSHPYSNSHHSHSGSQIISIAGLSAFQTLEASQTRVSEVMLPEFHKLDYWAPVCSVTSAHHGAVRLRGPPAF